MTFCNSVRPSRLVPLTFSTKITPIGPPKCPIRIWAGRSVPFAGKSTLIGCISTSDRSGSSGCTLIEHLPPSGSLSFMRKVFASLTSMSDIKVISFCPLVSLTTQRLIEATQSPVDAKRKGVRELLGRHLVLVDHLRLDLALLVGREQRVVDHGAAVPPRSDGRSVCADFSDLLQKSLDTGFVCQHG
jgi:hypothetical protein